MIIADVFAGIDTSEYECSAYRRKDKERGWVWEVALSFPRPSGRTAISIGGNGKTLESALLDIFQQAEELSLLQYYTKPAVNSLDDDIPF